VKGPIVVAVDGLEGSGALVHFAAQLARGREVELQLVHVHGLTSTLRRVHAADVSFGLAAREEAHARMKSLANLANTATRIVLLEGDVVPVLLRHIERVRPSFLVLAIGETAANFEISSKLQSLLRCAHAPVICCSQHLLGRDPGFAARRILAVLDGSAQSETVLPVVRELTADAAIILLQIIESADQRKAAQSYLDDHAHSLRAHGFSVITAARESVQPAATIIEQVKRFEADFAAFASYLPSTPGSLGECVNGVLSRAEVPVLVINPWLARPVEWPDELEPALAEAWE
jgi:nucleotide-binding universal stress UspA family protein